MLQAHEKQQSILKMNDLCKCQEEVKQELAKSDTELRGNEYKNNDKNNENKTSRLYSTIGKIVV